MTVLLHTSVHKWSEITDINKISLFVPLKELLSVTFAAMQAVNYNKNKVTINY